MGNIVGKVLILLGFSVSNGRCTIGNSGDLLLLPYFPTVLPADPE